MSLSKLDDLEPNQRTNTTIYTQIHKYLMDRWPSGHIYIYVYINPDRFFSLIVDTKK